MKHSEFNHILESIDSLSPEQTFRLRRELESKIAAIEERTSDLSQNTGEGNPVAPETIWELAAEIRRRIPREQWGKLPTDGAEQHDHYLYGAPKHPVS